MELWDIYDGSGRRTGQTMYRGDPFPEGALHLVVEIWLVHPKTGHYLLQQRSLQKRSMGGRWSATTGCAQAGEDARTTAIRELGEELGIKAAPSDLIFLREIFRLHALWEVYALPCDHTIESLTLQPEEVSDARWVSRDELLTMIDREEMFLYPEIKELSLEARRAICPHIDG